MKERTGPGALADAHLKGRGHRFWATVERLDMLGVIPTQEDFENLAGLPTTGATLENLEQHCKQTTDKHLLDGVMEKCKKARQVVEKFKPQIDAARTLLSSSETRKRKPAAAKKSAADAGIPILFLNENSLRDLLVSVPELRCRVTRALNDANEKLTEGQDDRGKRAKVSEQSAATCSA